MPTLTEDIDLPGGVEPSTVSVTVQLWGDGEPVTGFELTSDTTIAGPYRAKGNPWTVDLVGNADIDAPAGTVYRVERTWPGLTEPLVDYVDMPTSAGTYVLGDHLTDPPAAVESSALSVHKDRSHRRFVRIPPAWGENAWFTGRDLAATQVVGVDFWGDSIGADGVGVSPSSSQATLGVAGLLETGLQAAYGDGGSGYRSGATAYATQTGSWTTEMGFGGVGYRATAGATIEWTGLRGNKIRFFYRNAGITGQFRWSVNGGGFTTVTTPAGFGLDPASVDVTGLSESSTHTFRVEWVSGTFVAHGVYAEKSTGVNLRRFGVSGRAAAHYSYSSLGRFKANTTNGSGTVTCTSPGWFDSSLIDKYLQGSGIPVSAKVTAVASATSLTIDKNATATASNVDVDVCLQDTVGIGVPGSTTNFDPFLNSTGCGRPHLLIVMLGANDPANADVTARQFRDGYSRILKPYYQASSSALTPSLVVAQEHQGNWFDIYGRWPEMTSVMNAIADGMGAAYVDHWGLGRRSHQYGEDQGWFADAIHPSNLGHQKLYYEPIYSLLTIGSS